MYIYIYTRVFPCASAHREARWNWSEVATMVSGYDPKVLSQELSHILSQTLSQMSYNFDRSAQKKKKTVALPKSGHYLILREHWHFARTPAGTPRTSLPAPTTQRISLPATPTQRTERKAKAA